jgi:glycosyltransferase involved in cell wall biosynthesis
LLEGSVKRPAIAYLAGTFPAPSETFVYREVRALRARGWDVITASLHAPERPLDASLADVGRDVIFVYDRRRLAGAALELVEHPLRVFTTFGTALLDAIAPGEPTAPAARAKLLAQALGGIALARTLRARGVEHIHCHFAHAPTSVGMYAARALGAPFSFTGHANDLFQRRGLLKRKLERAAFVACISRWHRELYREIHPETRDKYVVIRCGVDLEQWRPEPRPSAAGPLHVLTVCRLVSKKGVDTLVRAIAALDRPALLTVAGDGPERRALEALAKDLGCADRVRFLGAVDNERVRRLMRDEAHVFALPCRTDSAGDRDGVPVVLIEAMACGLPVISGDLPAIRELIEHGVDGLLVPPGDSARLAAALGSLTERARAELGVAARDKVEREFSLATSLQRLEMALRAASGQAIATPVQLVFPA